MHTPDDGRVLLIQTGFQGDAGVEWLEGFFVVRGLDEPLWAVGQHADLLANLNAPNGTGPYASPGQNLTGRWLAADLGHSLYRTGRVVRSIKGAYHGLLGATRRIHRNRTSSEEERDDE